VETFGAVEDQYRDWHLVLGCCWQLKKWTQSDGGVWEKIAIANRWLKQCTVHSWHKL
jgi:hypothetical protein